MKKTLLSAVLIASFGVAALASMSAHAASSGTINFTGKVITDSCVVSVNGSGTSTGTVGLPVVFNSVLSTVGNVAGKTPFTIGLTGCDSNVTSAQALFTGSGIDTTSGNLINTGTATNVEVQLLAGTTTVMPLQNSTAAGQLSPVGTLSSNATTLSYSAQYVAVGGAGAAGTVLSTVGFTLTYQ